MLLNEDQRTVKLADLGLAREETLTEMMTSETGTYRWMAPEVFLFHWVCLVTFPKFIEYILTKSFIIQLYSTVTLRHGEKKHYNHKVDVYSFAIVLWELLHNKLPFEGMSNLQAAYAAAFKVISSIYQSRITRMLLLICNLFLNWIYDSHLAECQAQCRKPSWRTSCDLNFLLAGGPECTS